MAYIHEHLYFFLVCYHVVVADEQNVAAGMQTKLPQVNRVDSFRR